MTKILKGYTIVPRALYVERKADRQTAAILEDMGRPGYVLVARQMGKTNLILNAKRLREEQGDVVAYLDLSNHAPDLRAFLRHIIDVAINQIKDLPDEIFARIHEARQRIFTLPHHEHELELEILLRCIPSRLIICLDEIDALTDTDYSDDVFSFIRSIYFSGRANFDCFDRLTYLLSGVAEPADIIKNKEVSPFNIGQKIYLEDFSESEFLEFLARAGIALPNDASAKIFRWTSGHPRMTWDVCTKIEDLLAEGVEITSLVVDDVVRGLYFSEVPIPPVDHIRRLVDESSEFRSALLCMHHGEPISDNIRTKLYLAGISQVNYFNNAAIFKNEIIKNALSEKYLSNFDISSVDLALLKIQEFFNVSKYSEALGVISTFVEFVSPSAPPFEIAYWAAKVQFRMESYGAVAELLQSVEIFPLKFLEECNFYLGLALYRSEQFEDAIKPLEITYNLARARNDFRSSAEAGIDLADCYFRTNVKKHDEALKICGYILSNESSIALEPCLEKSSDEILVAAYRVAAQIEARRERKAEALRLIRHSENRTYGWSAIETVLLGINWLDYDRQREQALDRALEYLRVLSQSSRHTGFVKNDVNYAVAYAFVEELSRLGRSRDVADAMNCIFILGGQGSINDVILNLGNKSVQAGNNRLTVDVINGSISSKLFVLPPDDLRNLLGPLITSAQNRIEVYASRYLNLFAGASAIQPLLADIRPLYLVQRFFYTHGDIISANVAIDCINNFSSWNEMVRPAQRISFEILKDYLKVLQIIRSKSSVEIQKNAIKNFSYKISGVSKFELPNFEENFPNLMRQQIGLHGRLGDAKPFTKSIGKIGRNEIVKIEYNGAIRTGKYKNFAKDIELGLCRLIEVVREKT